MRPEQPTIRCTTEQPNGSRHRITVRSHELHTDLGLDDGGQDSAPGAHDYFDASLAACKALTAVWYARKHGMPLEQVDAQVQRDNSAERSGAYRLLVHLAFQGPLTEDQRARIYAAVARCPVSKLMTATEVIIETAPLEPAAPT
jgi:putative redox protein